MLVTYLLLLVVVWALLEGDAMGELLDGNWEQVQKVVGTDASRDDVVELMQDYMYATTAVGGRGPAHARERAREHGAAARAARDRVQLPPHPGDARRRRLPLLGHHLERRGARRHHGAPLRLRRRAGARRHMRPLRFQEPQPRVRALLLHREPPPHSPLALRPPSPPHTTTRTLNLPPSPSTYILNFDPPPAPSTLPPPPPAHPHRPHHRPPRPRSCPHPHPSHPTPPQVPPPPPPPRSPPPPAPAQPPPPPPPAQVLVLACAGLVYVRGLLVPVPARAQDGAPGAPDARTRAGPVDTR